MTDPLVDPDDPELLTVEAARALAVRVEQAQLAAGAVRYGRVGRVGCAQVVLNTENPLPSGCFAVGLDSSSATVGHTLLALEQTSADAGRAEALVHASPTTVAEIEGLADDAGWFAVTEGVVVVRLTPPASADGVVVDAVDHAHVVDAVDEDLLGAAELVADAVDFPLAGTPQLVKLLGHRVDEPRSLVLVVRDPEQSRPLGVALAHAGASVGVVEQVVVRSGRRRRGLARALLTAVTARLFELGVEVVAAQVEEAGAEEALAEAAGFVPAYPVTTYARRVDELL